VEKVFYEAMRLSLLEYGYDIADRYREVVEHHLATMFEVGAISQEGDEYTGQFVHVPFQLKTATLKTAWPEAMCRGGSLGLVKTPWCELWAGSQRSRLEGVPSDDSIDDAPSVVEAITTTYTAGFRSHSQVES
jgi:hypothetical protein